MRLTVHPGLGVLLVLVALFHLNAPAPKADPVVIRPGAGRMSQSEAFHPETKSPAPATLAYVPPPPRDVRVDAGRAAVRSVSRFGSNSALASFAPGPAEPVGPETHYMDVPAKGVYAWAAGERVTAKMKEYRSGRNAFDYDGDTYTVGFKYDWSVDAVLGLSVGRMRGTVKSGFDNDTRRNDIDGTIFTAHYDGYAAGKYPVSVQAFYGRLATGGKGAIGPARTPWREDAHKSEYYGASARVGLPLLLMDQYKLLTEIGVDYRRLKTGSYGYRYGEGMFAASGAVPATMSESLLVPMDVTVSRDYPQVWGVVTPYLGGGLAFELKKTATGLRAWNASAASGTASSFGVALQPGFDEWKSAVASVRAGVEARTVGGWEVNAQYLRTMTNGYSENRFGLELGRCF